MPKAPLDSLPKVTLECSSCGHSFEATMFSRAFTDNLEFICTSCGIQTWISQYSHSFRYVETKSSEIDISNYLKPCECDGCFAFVGSRYDLYRCPKCKELLEENYILSRLGIDKATLDLCRPLDSNVVIDGESVEYTHPGLETVGDVINETPWRSDIADAQFHKALAKDVQLKKDYTRHQAKIDEAIRKIKTGVFPPELYLIPDLVSFLYFRCGHISHGINPTDLDLTPDLIRECNDWGRLGSYIEDGVWGKGDLPESFKKTSWAEYYKTSLEIQKKLQKALGNRTVVRVNVEPNGTPFFAVVK